MRVLVVSDIHSNLVALNAVLQDAGEFDKVWCLGDIVGYGPQPNECIERLRAYDLVSLVGNHDLAVIGKIALWDFSPEAQAAVFFTRHSLSVANREWLETLAAVTVLAEYGITLVHGSLRDPVGEYLTTPGVARYSFNLMDTPIGLNGHTHVPIAFRFAQSISKPEISTERLKVNLLLALTPDRWLINPGSVGQPRDEDARAAYALLDLNAMTLTHRRVPYDIAATQKLMRDAKLPDRLIRRLRFGD